VSECRGLRTSNLRNQSVHVGESGFGSSHTGIESRNQSVHVEESEFGSSLTGIESRNDQSVHVEESEFWEYPYGHRIPKSISTRRESGFGSSHTGIESRKSVYTRRSKRM
jgi:hypothetical protein